MFLLTWDIQNVNEKMLSTTPKGVRGYLTEPLVKAIEIEIAKMPMRMMCMTRKVSTLSLSILVDIFSSLLIRGFLT